MRRGLIDLSLILVLLPAAVAAKNPMSELSSKMDGKAQVAGVFGPVSEVLPHVMGWLERLAELDRELDTAGALAEAKKAVGVNPLDPNDLTAVGFDLGGAVGYQTRDPDNEMVLVLPVADKKKVGAFLEKLMNEGASEKYKKARKGSYKGATLWAFVRGKGKSKRIDGAYAVKGGYVWFAAGDKEVDKLKILKRSLGVTKPKSLARKKTFLRSVEAVGGGLSGLLLVDLEQIVAAEIKNTRKQINKLKKKKGSAEAAMMKPMLDEQLKVFKKLAFMEAGAVAVGLEAKKLTLRGVLLGKPKGLSPWTDVLKAPGSKPFPRGTFEQKSPLWAVLAIDTPGLLKQLRSSFPLGAALIAGVFQEMGPVLGLDIERDLLPALTGDVAYVMLGAVPFSGPNFDKGLFPDELMAFQFLHGLFARVQNVAVVHKALGGVAQMAQQQGEQLATRQEGGATVYAFGEEGVSFEWGIAGDTAVLTAGSSPAFSEAVAMQQGSGQSGDEFLRFSLAGPLLADWMGQIKLPATMKPGSPDGAQWAGTRKTLATISKVDGRFTAKKDRVTGELLLELK